MSLGIFIVWQKTTLQFKQSFQLKSSCRILAETALVIHKFIVYKKTTNNKSTKWPDKNRNFGIKKGRTIFVASHIPLRGMCVSRAIGIHPPQPQAHLTPPRPNFLRFHAVFVINRICSSLPGKVKIDEQDDRPYIFYVLQPPLLNLWIRNCDEKGWGGLKKNHAHVNLYPDFSDQNSGFLGISLVIFFKTEIQLRLIEKGIAEW